MLDRFVWLVVVLSAASAVFIASVAASIPDSDPKATMTTHLDCHIAYAPFEYPNQTQHLRHWDRKVSIVTSTAGDRVVSIFVDNIEPYTFFFDQDGIYTGVDSERIALYFRDGYLFWQSNIRDIDVGIGRCDAQG